MELKYTLLMAVVIGIVELAFSQPGNPSVHVFSEDELEEANTYLNYHPYISLQEQTVCTIPPMSGQALTAIGVFDLDQTSQKEQIIWSIENQYSFPEILTTHRVGNILTKEFINFDRPFGTLPTINTYYRLSPFTVDADYELLLGRSNYDLEFPASNLQGKLAEVILYDRVLSDRELLRVNTYLALKYGIPIQGYPYAKYYNSAHQIIWDGKEYPDFQYNITGLGRDDASGLYQKQATSAYIPNLLNIGLNEIATLNSRNQSQIPDNIFLIWANNDGNLQEDVNLPHYLGRKLSRDWLIHGYDFFSNTAGLEIQLNGLRLELEPKEGEILWLLVDRSGQGTFGADHTDFIPEDTSAVLSHLHSFSEFSFDTDATGNDIISFSYGPTLLPVIWVDSILCDSGSPGKITIGVEGGVAPYNYQLFDSKGVIISQWTAISNSRRVIDNLHSGKYVLLIKDSKGTIQEQEIYLSSGSTVASYTDISTSISQDQINLLDFLSFTPVKQEWFGPIGFYSLNTSIEPDQGGEYHVLFKDESGCTQHYNFNWVNTSLVGIEKAILSPNPSGNGVFLLRLKLAQAGPARIQVITVDGQIIHSMSKTGDYYYEFQHTVLSPGAYFIHIVANGESRTIQFIYSQ